MNEQKSIENGFCQEIVLSCRDGIPQNWRDILSEKHCKPFESVVNEQSMMVNELKKKNESPIQDNQTNKTVTNTSSGKAASSKKKTRAGSAHPTRTIVLEEPEERVEIDEELHIPVRRSSRHHQPPLPFWENSYMIYNERLGRSEVVIGPNSSVKGLGEVDRRSDGRAEDIAKESQKEVDDDDEFMVKSESDGMRETSASSDEEDSEKRSTGRKRKSTKKGDIKEQPKKGDIKEQPKKGDIKEQPKKTLKAKKSTTKIPKEPKRARAKQSSKELHVRSFRHLNSSGPKRRFLC